MNIELSKEQIIVKSKKAVLLVIHIVIYRYQTFP